MFELSGSAGVTRKIHFNLIQNSQNLIQNSGGSHAEVRGKRAGMDPSRATCQAYGTQMLLIHYT